MQAVRSIREGCISTDAAYMAKVGLPQVVDTLLRRVVRNQPTSQKGVWMEIHQACQEELILPAEAADRDWPMQSVRQLSAGEITPEDFAERLVHAKPSQQRIMAREVARMCSVATSSQHTDAGTTSSLTRATRSDIQVSQLPVVKLYQELAEESATMLKADLVYFHLYDSENEMIYDPIRPDKRISVKAGALGKAILANAVQPFMIGHEQLSDEDRKLIDGNFTQVASALLRDEKDLRVIAIMTAVSSRPLHTKLDVLGKLAEKNGTILSISIAQNALAKARKQINVLLDVASKLASELQVTSLIQAIMEVSRDLLHADRSTLFLVDEDKNELWSSIADGTTEIRIPKSVGIAGSVASTGTPLNIPDAYSDPRFNQDIDRKTGYHTNSLLCMPLRNRTGKVIGVTQMINKKDGGAFLKEDMRLLGAFSDQAAVAIENSILFKRMEESKNLFENVLSSIKSLILTLNKEGKLININHDPMEWGIDWSEEQMRNQPFLEWFPLKHDASLNSDGERRSSMMRRTAVDSYVNGLLREDIRECYLTGSDRQATDYCFVLEDTGRKMVMNYTIMALVDFDGNQTGVVVLMEDVSTEKHLMTTLGKYMSPELVAAALEGGTTLGGQQLVVSVLFVDIRNFTGLSEDLSPTDVVETLNEYFEMMGGAVMDCGGVVDKYIGDAVMAVFGVPFSSDSDADRACRCALMMCRRLDAWNRKRAEELLPPIRMGVGVNTGEVVAGNIGFERRMEYTVIGDGVNLASRVEGATKEYNVQSLVTEHTFGSTSSIIAREVDCIRVVGKKKPVKLYELQGVKGEMDISQEQEQTNAIFHNGLHLYRNRKWHEARGEFQRAIDLSKDGVSQTFLKRCDYFISNPDKCPEEDWDGVWIMSSK